MTKTFSIGNRGKYKVITLTGDATTLSVLKSLHESINNLLLLGDKHFVFDFSKTHSLNSQILGVLAKLYTTINAENGTCSVILKDKEQEDVFNLVGLHLLVKVINTIDEIIPEKPDENSRREETALFENDIVTILEKNGFKIIRGKEELSTIQGCVAFDSLMKKHINEEDKKIVLDLCGVTLLTSTFIGSISSLYQKVSSYNGEMYILSEDENINNVLDITGLHSFIRIYNSQEELFDQVKTGDESISQELILVVDDSKTMRELIVKKVKTLGYPVIIAKNGKEAVEQTLLHNPCLILMDVQMPEMDGFEACRIIKSKVFEKHIPIIFVTTLQEPREKLKALEVGGDDYINKPVQDEDLIFRIKAHLKVRELTESLEEMNKNLEKKVEEKSKALVGIERQLYQAEKMSVIGTMLSGIAHELKNPLFIIGLKAQRLLQMEDMDDKLTKAITDIEEQTIRSTKIIENLLKLVRKRVEEVVVLDVSKLIKDLKINIDYLLDNKSIEIKLDLAKNCIIQGNVTEIEQIIINLVSNAVDAINENGVITVKTRDSKDTWLVEIEDNGSGMSQEVQKKIFDPFYTTKEVGKGTGLGMSIVYRIVENHKGKIQIRSEEGKGTTFSIYFPKYN